MTDARETHGAADPELLDRLERAHYAIIGALFGAMRVETDQGLWVHSPYIDDPEWNHLGRLETAEADVDALGDAVATLARPVDRRPTLVVGPLSRPRGLADALESRGWSVAYRHTWSYQPTPDLRPAGPQEDVAVRRVEGPDGLRTFMDIFSAVFTPDDPAAAAQYRTALAASVEHQGPARAVHYLATHEGHPAGVASLGYAHDVAGAFNLGVLPPFRGRGIAGELVRHRLKRARAEGVEHVYVLTEEPEMTAWQTRWGYRKVMTTEGWSAPAID